MKKIKKFYKKRQKLIIKDTGAIIFIKSIDFKKVLV